MKSVFNVEDIVFVELSDCVSIIYAWLFGKICCLMHCEILGILTVLIFVALRLSRVLLYRL